MTEEAVRVRRGERAKAPTAFSPWAAAEGVVVFAATAVAAIGTAGLALAILGSYSTWLAVLLAVPPGAFCAVVVIRRPAEWPGFGWQPLLFAVAIVLAATAFWAMRPSQHVLVNRDAGSYTTTAALIESTGSLRVEGSDTPFAGVEARPEGATYVVGPGEYEFQFNHLLPAALAPVLDVLGERAMFRFPSVVVGVGLLALYLLSVRATRRPWLSVVVPAVLAVSLPMLYIARDTFSESLAFMLLWCGMLPALAALRGPRWDMGALAGLLIGSTIAVRVDSLAYLVATVPLLVFWVGRGRESDIRQRFGVAVAMLAGAAVPGVVGWIDLQWFSGNYASDLATQITQLRMALAGAFVVSVLAVWMAPAARRWIQPVRARLALGCGLAVVLALSLLWFVRPIVMETTYDPSPALTGYQAAEGIGVDPSRSHYENSFEWMEWYFGPLVVSMAVAGFGITTTRVVSGRAGREELLLLAIGGAVGLLFWWRPSIFADQPWASRRFSPAVYPACVAMAALALSWVSGALRSAPDLTRRALVGTVAGFMVLAPLATTWPVRWGRTQAGYAVMLDSLCEHLGSDAAVVTVEARSPKPVAPGVRAWCNVPTAALDDPSQEELTELADEWSEQGRTLWVVGDDHALVAQFADGGADLFESAPGVGQQAIERTLLRAPEEYRDDETLSLWAVPVAPG